MLRETLQKIASEYASATGEPFTDHPLANYIRQEAPSVLTVLASRSDGRFKCKGSAGAGNFAAVPWLAVFDNLVTTSATQGYYVVYLFAHDGNIFLSLNQGTTAVRREFGKSTAAVLRDRASLMRARLPEYAELLPVNEIELRTAGQLPRDYEAGHSIGCNYQVDQIPGENELSSDLHNALSAYTTLTFRGGLEPSLEGMPSQQDEFAPTIGDLFEIRQYRMHRTIERNAKLAGMAKLLLGTKCQVCGFDFEGVYGEIGKGFIEAHHLQPLASLIEGVAIAVDPVHDFAVLCSNCHRMIHRLGAPNDLTGLRAIIQRTKKARGEE
jgi:5-methylcytosine-specific restriction enzyme A